MAAEILNNEKMRVPKLRFKEFEGEWEEKRLNQLIRNLQSGKSVNSEDRPIENDLEFGILKTSSVVSGNFIDTENKKIVDNEIALANLNPTKDEIIISRMNTPQLVGESGYINETYKNLFVPDRLWQTVTHKDKCHNKWLSQFLITERVRYNLKSIATGTSGTMKNISKPNFLSILVNSPTLPEQQKIASFLTAVDKKLEQLNKKKEALAHYKKGVMQGLFSQALRFKDDDGESFPDWEEKKLGEVSNHISYGLTVRPNFLVDGIPLISAREITSGKVDITKAPRISVEDFNNLSDKAKPKKGDIFLTKTGTIGFTARFNGNFPIAITQNIAVIRLDDTDSSSPFYLMQYFKTRGFYRSAISKVNQSTIMDLQLGDIRKLIIPFPSFKEQQKIASYLSALDAKIAVVAKQVEETAVFKKGLLQGMFV